MKKILIVEDEEGLLDGLAHNFRYEGYEVLTAKNGQEGLKLALKQKPDAVLLDIMLPEKDGFTVLKELRQRHRDIPVLVMTARNFEADVLKGFVPVRYTVHVNGPWCITFEFDAGDALRVDYEQYH